MRKFIALSLLGLAATACTPPEVEYCRATGATPSQLEQCTRHFYSEEAAFRSDLRFCAAQADQTYPPSLYSGWGTARVHGGYGFGGQWRSAQSYTIPPDYQKNAQLDSLRMNIIEPCMQSRGWNSGATWQAGRRAPALGTTKNLPWAE